MSIVPVQIEGIERALLQGDLSQLTDEQRLAYYQRVCESLGLNPLTKPFEYLRLNGRLVLYANRSCADQLRQIHGVSTEIVSQQQVGDLYVVHVRARTRDGRVDEDLGIVSTRELAGDALGNAILKAVTKAKRRVTLSICGLGWLDETEVESIPGAVRVSAEQAHGQAALPAGAPDTPAPHEPNGSGESAPEALAEPPGMVVEASAEVVERPAPASRRRTPPKDPEERARIARSWLEEKCRENGVTLGWAMEWLRSQGKGDLSKLQHEDLVRAREAIEQQGQRVKALAGARRP